MFVRKQRLARKEHALFLFFSSFQRKQKIIFLCWFIKLRISYCLVHKVYNLILSGWTKTDTSDNVKDKSHELRLHEINTLEWDDLVDANDHNASTMHNGGK